ncbi:MAG: preprotein translocase subunit SecE [Oscillospiraceae bacterium]|nr:preprotein translocase subunit SecE [Oscillospiraceae bacterium]
MADKETKAVQAPDAQDKSAKKEAKKEKAKKPNAFVRRIKSIGKYFREMKSELKKVVWPSRKTVFRNTVVVILVVLVLGVLIWVFDWLAAAVISALVHLFS